VKEKYMGLLPVALVQDAEDNADGKTYWESVTTRPNRLKDNIKNYLARDRL
jgi:hypothetical protein